MRPSNDLENNILWDTCWRDQLVCMEDQAHSSLEQPLESEFVSEKNAYVFKARLK